jgi:hypothetical protein
MCSNLRAHRALLDMARHVINIRDVPVTGAWQASDFGPSMRRFSLHFVRVTILSTDIPSSVDNCIIGREPSGRNVNRQSKYGVLAFQLDLIPCGQKLDTLGFALFHSVFNT